MLYFSRIIRQTLFRTIKFSAFAFEGLSILISCVARARAHASLYINLHDFNAQKQTRKWFCFQSMIVLTVVFIAVTITGIKKSHTYGSSHFLLLRASLPCIKSFIYKSLSFQIWDAETIVNYAETKQVITVLKLNPPPSKFFWTYYAQNNTEVFFLPYLVECNWKLHNAIVWVLLV